MSSVKVMILGAGIFQLPLIEKANALGYQTVVLSNIPDDPGLIVASHPYLCSTRDKERALQIAKSEKIDGVLTIASEMAMGTVVFISSSLGLPGISVEQEKVIFSKNLLKEELIKAGIDHPTYHVAPSLEEGLGFLDQLSFPFYIKPMQSSGSNGVFEINSLEQFETCFHESMERSVINKVVLLESAVIGQEYGGDCVVQHGRVVFLSLTQKYKDKQHIPRVHMLFTEEDEELKRKVKKLIQQVVDVLRLDSTLLNFDVIHENGKAILIDLGARLGGNGIPRATYEHSGVDTLKVALDQSLGLEVQLGKGQKKKSTAVFIQKTTVNMSNEEHLLPWREGTDVLFTSNDYHGLRYYVFICEGDELLREQVRVFREMKNFN